MTGASRSARAAGACSVVVALLLVALAGCGGDDEPGRATTGAQPTTLPTTIETSTSTVATSPDGPRDDLVVGIGEQLAKMFTAEAFGELDIKYARLVVAYDATRVDFERAIVDQWLGAARAAGVEPFITFHHSRVKPKRLPSVAEFRRDFRAFRKRYPQVKVYAPWNEVNHVSQPTSKSPKRAAEYYNVVVKDCGDCTVLAGDVLDQPGMTRYLASYRRHLDGSPRIWGLHNYADANRFRKSGLAALLKAVRGDIWLTETGGLVEFGRNFPRDEERAAKAVDFALELASDTPRVKRVYFYNWTGTKPGARFDAGLTDAEGKPRKTYDALKSALKR